LLYQLVRRLARHHDAVGEALRVSQERLTLALEAANQGLYDLDIPTGKVVVNTTYAAMLGYDPATFHETHAGWVGRMHPEDQERVAKNFADYLAGTINNYRVEFRQRTANGEWRWLHSMGRIVERDHQGRPTRLLGTHTDITERKSREAQALDALAFIRAVLNASPAGIIAYGPDGGCVIANQVAARIVGTDVPGLLQQNFRHVESWRQHGLLADAEQALASGHPVRSNRSFVTSFGRALQADIQFVPFEHQAGRHLLMLLSDETEKMRVLDRLQMMHAAILAAPVGWMVTDPSGIIEWVNPGFTNLTGYTTEDAVGRNPRVLKTNRHAPEFYAEMWATIKRGEVWSGEMFNQRKDGSMYHEYMTIAPVRNGDGKISHFVAMKQDITDRKNLEQQLARAQRLESIGLLASGIAHDLNNIFAPIQLSLELLRIKYPTADGKKMIEVIESSVHRGAGIVRQVLTFARGIESERMILQPKYLVKELAQIVAETLPREIRIETQLSGDLQAIEGDSTQLHQVLLNLAINARDAMPHGGTLTLGAENTQVDAVRALRNPPLKPGPHVALTVTDTGTGIPPEVLEHIFEPFYTTKPRGKGTGLGLSTVYGIVRGHGGAVEVATKVNAGTRFTVLLPARDTADARPDSHPPVPETVQGNGRRVLLVDDEEPIRLITMHTLQRHGFIAEVAVDGVEGLEIFRTDPARFSVVITDLMMPRMGGREMARAIRAIAPTLPVIASSGLSEEKADETPENSLAALRVKTILRKPYTEAELLAALRRELAPAAEKKD
jgi:PAS domain S-box-containing protein